MKKMSSKAVEARREYYRRWRAANPEKVREKNIRYWEKRAEREKEIRDEQNEED